jgi:hypothetical protein
MPGVLPREVALEIAELAGVPEARREHFCDLVSQTVYIVWRYDRRAVSSKKPGRAFVQAVEAARVFHEQLQKVSEADREWVASLSKEFFADKDHLNELEQLRDKRIHVPFFGGDFGGLQRTVYRIAHMLAIAVNKSPPKAPGVSGRSRTVKDPTFQRFVRDLLINAELAHGRLSLEASAQSGTLIAAIEKLREYLPPGVVPASLPIGTIQKIKNNWRKFYTESVQAGLPLSDLLPDPRNEN